MALSSDPYEQRLYSLFQEHDVHSQGKLNREALLKLCKTLELPKPAELLKRLLREGKTQVSFGEFREGLLYILSGEEPEEPSPSPAAVQQHNKPHRAAPGQSDSSDGQNVSTGSPTVASPSAVSNTSSNAGSTSITAGSISSNTSKHPHQFTYRRDNETAAAESESSQSSVVKIVGCSSRLVPSGESEDDDLVQTTINPTTPTTTTTTTTSTTVCDNENESSDREVSPKFVVGTKKYGRRSRPREDCNGVDSSSDFSNSDNESVPQQHQHPQQPQQIIPPSTDNASSKNSSSKVQRSASQSDIHGSKRRRPMSGSRLKRCASLPTHRQRPDLGKLNAKNVRDQLNMDQKIDKKIYFMKLSENLRDIWNSLVGSGHGDLLNQSQLEIVCERVGLQKLPAKLAAREVFAKLSLQPIEGISFDDFISLLQSDSDILPIGGGEMEPTVGGNCGTGGVRVRLFDESDTFKVQELDRDSVEETVGFTMRMPEWTAEIGSLSAAIIIDMWESAGIGEPRSLLQDLGFYGEEVQVTELIIALEDEQQRLGDGNDTSVVVRASLALHKAEVTALRQAFLQLMEENKKLYSDNKEANQRAQLLLQEVDERHNSLESATRNKIRLLEQRHHETVKELTSQLAFEREQLSCANAGLEKRIQGLEQDEGKLKAEMNRLLEENDGLRAEQENLTKELTDMLEKNIRLNRDIAELEENNRNDFDDEFDGKNDLEVLELIEKNSLLQDKNKELKDKNDELCVEIETLNVELAKFKLKRSGISRTSSLDVSPVMVEVTGFEENSSAARKRQGDSPSKARLSDESPRLGKFRKCSNDVENESDSSGDWMALHSELGLRVDSAIASPGVNVEGGSKEEEIQQLKAKIFELEKKLNEKKGNEKIESESVESGSRGTSQTEKVKLKARCDELEASLEQMSKEYEACEDYWQAKLNEERLLYEEEQRVADEKFNELLKKMAEYEEQFSGQSSNKNEDGRLSPIEEKDVLEQQYLDLEGEFQQSQLILEEKAHEVEKLRSRILELEQLTKYPSEALLATPDMESPASSPISYLWNQSTIQAPATRDYQNPHWCHPSKVNSTPLEQGHVCDDGSTSSKLNASLSSLPSKVADELKADAEDAGFDRTISPIQKPIVAGTSSTPCTATEGQELLADCSDVCSVKSARSAHSLASTHSIHKSVSQTDVAMISQEQLKLLELQDEIKDLTHQRDCLKMEFQQLNEVKPILARAYTKTAHPNLTQKIQHLEQKNRQLQSMLKQQQAYTEQILHQIWQQQRSEISELRNRLEAQNMIISDQASRLANNDQLVRELYVENGRLISQVQRLEQQKARASMLQQLSQATASAHCHPGQLSGIVPGMP
ncbi:ninein homolog isoform X2 [Ochlerotatus camptorhynchus]|uniref:ninein homolog isoform X2 n=1 Tax=Ochlerotatus camptorhynchus TaxID=644619 RepID=UPI0031DA7BCA